MLGRDETRQMDGGDSHLVPAPAAAGAPTRPRLCAVGSPRAQHSAGAPGRPAGKPTGRVIAATLRPTGRCAARPGVCALHTCTDTRPEMRDAASSSRPPARPPPPRRAPTLPPRSTRLAAAPCAEASPALPAALRRRRKHACARRGRVCPPAPVTRAGTDPRRRARPQPPKHLTRPRRTQEKHRSRARAAGRWRGNARWTMGSQGRQAGRPAGGLGASGQRVHVLYQGWVRSVGIH